MTIFRATPERTTVRPKRFNLRVYGLAVHTDRVLLVEEQIRGRRITKFPGGGLELGEGPIDCLVREFREETGADIHVREHVYTTGFFQPSAFSPDDQIISIYYRVESPALRPPELPVVTPDAILGFRWVPLEDIVPQDLTLPIDRYVVEHCLHGLVP